MLDFKKSSIFSEQLVFIKNLVYCHHLNLSFTVNCVLIQGKVQRNSELEPRPFPFSSDFANETIVPSYYFCVSLTYLIFSFA